MAFEPYLISEFKTGLHTTKQPDIAPRDAFTSLVNARVNRGVLEKRQGFSEIAQMKHGGTPVTNPITGLYRFQYQNRVYVLICDKARINVLDQVNSDVEDISGGTDVWSGVGWMRFHFWQWKGQCLITNGQDRVKIFDGSTFQYGASYAVTNLGHEITGSQFMQTCKWIFDLKDRLIFLDTLEGNANDGFTWNHARMRYTPVLSAQIASTTLQSSEYIDAPTDKRMITAYRLGNEIIVWFDDGLFKIKPTGNTTVPFKWERIREGDGAGALSRHVQAKYNDGCFTIGRGHFIFYDAYRVRFVDFPNLRGWLGDTVDYGQIERYASACYDEENRRMFIGYPSSGASNADRWLEYNTEENNFADMVSSVILPTCMVTHDGQTYPLYTDLPAALGLDATATPADFEITGQDPIGQTNAYPIFGARDGKIYQGYSGANDVNSAVVMDAYTARFNPFRDQGRKAALSHVNILADVDANSSFTISAFVDQSSTAHHSQAITLSGNGSKDWFRFDAMGEVGADHRLRIYDNATGSRPRIHAIELWFRPSERLGL